MFNIDDLKWSIRRPIQTVKSVHRCPVIKFPTLAKPFRTARLTKQSYVPFYEQIDDAEKMLNVKIKMQTNI